MEEASLCCGGAGGYVIAQGAFARRLLERKMRRVAATGAQLIVTANPGCMLQLQAGLRLFGLPGRVCHLAELLDRAYRAPG